MSIITSPPRLARLFCVLDGTHEDRAVADLAVTGRFVHAGTTLDLGRGFDWTTCGLPDDEEWRIEFVKLYEGLALARAFEETGDDAYLTTWVDLVQSYATSVPVGFDSSDVSGRRIQNWLYAAQRFAQAPSFESFPDGFMAHMVDRLQLDLEHLRQNLTAERNHRTLEIYALLLSDLALENHESARADLALLADNADADIWADGVQRECSSDYHMIVLRSLVGALHNAQLVRLPVPAALVAATNRAADFALWLHRPDGTTPALSDGDQGDFRPLMSLAGDVLGRDDLAWVGSNGTMGTRPTSTGRTFVIGGYHFWRTDWTGSARWGVFDCGPIGDGGHGHYDQLSVELADGPKKLVVDPGRYTYAENDDGWRHWFKGTAAHNTVTVDGLDQVPYRRGRPKGTLSRAVSLGRRNAGGLDAAVGRIVSPNYDAAHTRTVILADNRFWVIHDQLRASDAHRYQARWHLDDRHDIGSLTVATFDDHVTVEGDGLRMILWGPPEGPSIDVAIEDGWISPEYGIKHPAPIVTVTVHAANSELFAAIGGDDGPTSLRSTEPTTEGVCVRLGFDQATESVSWDSSLQTLNHERSIR